MPEVSFLDREARYRRLLERTKGMAPALMAVAHPCDADSMGGVVRAAEAGLIIPVLVGPEQKIRALAREHGFDLGSMEIVGVAHSHDAAARSVALVRGDRADALITGSLHTDEPMTAVVAVAGRADILVVPDLESGNMLAKQLEYLADALLAGVVVGASVPIVLTSRADSVESRAASCAIALLIVRARRKRPV